MNKQITSRRSLVFVILTVSGASSISMLGGVFIESVADKLLPIIPLLIAMPAMNTMVGDYATIIASYEELQNKKHGLMHALYKAIAQSVLLNILAVTGLSICLALLKGYAMNTGFVIKYIVFIVGSITITVLTIVLITKILESALRSHKLNVDDVLIPIITSVTDVLMLSMIAAGALLLI